MTGIVTVPVLRACEINGRAYVRGDRVTLPAIEAALHARHGRVTLTRGARVEADPAPASRRYRRRDLEAEP